MSIRGNAAIIGIGATPFMRQSQDGPMRLAANALRAALLDAGAHRDQIDGLAIHTGSPLGVDYDRFAEAMGLNLRHAAQYWTHGRFITLSLQNAALTVISGLAEIVACVTVVKFLSIRGLLGNSGLATMTVRPTTSPDSAPLWKGFEVGRIIMPRCQDCGHCRLPPGPVCPRCFSPNLKWHQASGFGTISTWVVIQRKYFEDFGPPYIVVQVELKEGPRLTANMPIEYLSSISVGMPVVAEFHTAANGMVLPLFRPRKARTERKKSTNPGSSTSKTIRLTKLKRPT